MQKNQASIGTNDQIFRMLLENVLNGSNWGAEYPFREDPLHLKTWASTRTENEIRDLASQFDCLKTVLFNAKNKSGSSLVDRHSTQKEPLPKGVIPLFAEDPKLGAIHAAAVFADINAFTYALRNYCLQRKPIPRPEKFLIEDFITEFLENCSLANIPQLWSLCSELEPVINYVADSPRNLLSLPFERFSVLTTVIWPFLSQEERTTLIVTSKNVDPSYNFLLMQLS